MTEQKITVNNKTDENSAALLVQTASHFKSRVMLRIGDKTASAKSIMGVISLDVKDGKAVSVIADGEDESAAVSALSRLLRV